MPMPFHTREIARPAHSSLAACNAGPDNRRMIATPALKGIRVVDFAAGIAGPHASLLLAHHGADVIKIEPPEGDWSRRLGVSSGGQSPFSAYYNRGKRSIALDLKTPAGRDLAFRLASEADVVVESFRPGVMQRLGLGHGKLRAARPGLVYLSVSGFGQEGPLAQLPATDTVIQGFSGLMAMNHDADGAPQRFPLIVVDVVSGLYAAQAAMAALIRSLRFGEGAFIDCSLLQSALALQAPSLVKHEFERGLPTVMYVPLGVLATRDGHISISVNRDQHFVDFCKALGREELATDARFRELRGRIENEKVLMKIIRAEFLRVDTDEWCRCLGDAGILHARIRGYDEVLRDPVLREQGVVDWIDQPGVAAALPIPNIPGGPRAAEYGRLAISPAPGQHSREILLEMGLAESDVADLLKRGVAVAPL